MKKFITKRKLKKKRRRKWLVVLVLSTIFGIGCDMVRADDNYYFSKNTIDGIYAITKFTIDIILVIEIDIIILC